MATFFAYNRHLHQKYDSWEEFKQEYDRSHARVMFFNQIWPKVNSFGSRGHQMKNIVFHGDCFSLIILRYERNENKMAPSFCLVELVRNMYFLALKDQLQNLNSVQVRSRSYHDRSRSICISSEAAWRAKSFGTICASLSTSCRELLANIGSWPHLTSGDIPVTPNHHLHLDHHRWGSGHDPERNGWIMRNGKHSHISP